MGGSLFENRRIDMDLFALRMAENRRNLKMTVLFRPGGTWHEIEVGRLCTGLGTEVSQHPRHLEHLVLLGHYTKEQTLKALLGGQAYTTRQITGMESSDLPFSPGFV